MKIQRMSIAVFMMLAILTFGGCVIDRYGRSGEYGGGGSVAGEVMSHNTAADLMEIQQDRGATVTVAYDSQTQMLYRGAAYPGPIRQGDYVSVSFSGRRDNQGRYLAEVITVRQTAQDRNAGGVGPGRNDRFGRDGAGRH
jgi:hypothetical protein